MSEEADVLSDVDRPETVRDFWNRAHGTDRTLWLTGSPGPEVWHRLGVEERVHRGAVVLNIGVGLGYCTKALADSGCIVHALDISPVALARVRDIAMTWRVDQIDELPRMHFDLALSHLVAQHMTDADLIYQIRAVCPALKRGGLFAMQFSSLADASAVRLREAPIDQKAGGVLRTPERMAEMVRCAGGVMHRMIARETWPNGAAWWVAQVRRRRWYDRWRHRSV